MKVGGGGRSWFWVVIATAIAVRIGYLLSFRASPLFDILIADQLYYREWALRIASGDLGGGQLFEQGPLYAYLLALLFRLLGTATAPVLAVQMLLGVVTVALVFSCARLVAGNRAALVAGLLAATFGPFLTHEGQLMKSFLEPLLLAAALYCCLRYPERRRAAWMAAACGAIGLACLVREVHLLLLPVILGWAAWKREPSQPWPGRLAAVAAGALVFAAALAPVALRNLVVGKEVVAVTAEGGEVFYMAFGPYAGPYYTHPPFVRPSPGLEHEDFRDEARLRTGRYLSRVECSRFWYSEFLRSLAADPLRALRLMGLRALITANDFEAPDSEVYSVAREVVPYLRPLPTFGFLVGLAVLGLLVSLPRREGLLIAAFLAAGLVGIMLSYPLGRFRLALLPPCLVMAGAGAAWIAGAWTRRRKLALAGVAFAGVISGLSFLPPPASRGWVQATEDAFRAGLPHKTEARDRIPVLEDSLGKAPFDPAVADDLANQLEVIGKWREARELYQRVLEADPGFETARWSLLSIHYYQREFTAALEQARLYTASFPASDAGHTARGVFAAKLGLERSGEERLGYLRESREHLDQGVLLNPESASALYYRGRMTALEGDRAGAVSDVSAALRLTPDFPEAFHLLQLLMAGAAAPSS